MRILVVGAGATGGYFGARLAESGRDVTFLVRPARAARLAHTGLVVRSVHGDAIIARPQTMLASELSDPFDLVVLSCKAYDLPAAIESFAPAVGKETLVLPLLNGMRQLEMLDSRFGASRVLGGLCVISSTLDDEGAIRHLNDRHQLVFGGRGSTERSAVDRAASVLLGAGFDSRVSDAIEQEMWEKWVLLATLAAATCLMRGSVGDVLAAPGGESLIVALLAECSATAERQGHPPRPHAIEMARAMLTVPGSTFTASMLRDIERGAPIEADHIVGDLVARADANDRSASPSALRIAYTHLKAYEARRARSAAASNRPDSAVPQ